MGGETAKQLPHNVDAERCVLGAAVVDPTNLHRAIEAGLVEPQQFFIPQHVEIFAALLELDRRRVPGDTVTLGDELQRTGRLEAAGGNAYLATIGDGMPRVLNVEHYAAIVRDKWLKRRLAHSGEANVQRALADAEPAAELLEQAESEIFELAEQRIRVGMVGMPAVVRERMEFIERLASGGGITGLSTGYADVDELTAGLHAQELIVLAARPGIGKSALAANIAHNVTMPAEGTALPVAMFSLEMSKELLVNRLLSWEARVDSWKFRKGWLSAGDVQRLVGAMARLSAAPLWIDDAAGSTVMDIAAKARRMKREHGLALVIVDYLQLVQPAVGRRFGTRNDEVGAMAAGLKALAKELRVPVMALAQLTRAPERDKRLPMLSDLRDSGEIEQHADVVMFIHRGKAFDADASEEERAGTQLIVAKQRNGPTETVKALKYLREFTRFEQGGEAQAKA